MKISYNWLKGYLPIEVSVEELADILTNIGLEVEGVEKHESVRGGLQGLIIGEVKKVEKHPDADRLKLTMVSTGNGGDLQIVCGAPNVAAGQRVLVAPVNTTIFPNQGEPFEIKKANIRGVESHGMICAEDEVGLGTSHEGIMVLPEDAPLGSTAREYFDIVEDWVFEIGLTPNRADANSHLGVARDLKAYFSYRNKEAVALNYPDLNAFEIDNKDLKIDVEVKSHQACPRYSGLTFTNVEVKPSPNWLKNKLKAIGVKPINNIVDITNFVLHEYGQPLHAFDADKIAGNTVVVKTLPKNTIFITLDDEQRKLDENDLMICDAEGGMCIAGVYGGKGSGVTESTKNIFLESAYFDPISIRKTATRHNLRTDAATHFEKGIDPNMTITALKRAALLFKELAGAKISSEIVDIYPEPVKPAEVNLDMKYVKRLTGANIRTEEVVRILHAMDFEITSEGEDGMELQVPTYKTDVTRPADVVEEILRVYGINNIPLPEHFYMAISMRKEPETQHYKNIISDMLSGNGFHEMITLSLTAGEHFKKAVPVAEEKIVRLYNSLSAELDVLRPDMLASGLESLEHNINRRNLDLKYYEFGKTYHRAGKEYDEKRHLALYLTGSKYPESWESKEKNISFYDLKGSVNAILKRLGLLKNISSEDISDNNFEYGMKYSSEGTEVATFGLVRQKILNAFDIKKPIFYADINWDILLDLSIRHAVKYSEISKFPSIRRDLALLIDKSVKYAEIKEIALKTAGELLKDINLFDIYEDIKIGKDKKSYAVSFVFSDVNKTLTDEEVDKVMDRLIRNFEKEISAEIRK